MDDNNTPRARELARQTNRLIALLVRDALIEYASARARGFHSSSSVADLDRHDFTFTNLMKELVDGMRTAEQLLAELDGRTVLSADERVVLIDFARQAIQLYDEQAGEDERARARALGDRVTAPAAPRGAFDVAAPGARGALLPPPSSSGTAPASAPRRSAPPPPPRRALPATVPVPAGDRPTAPGRPALPPPYKGGPRPRSGVQAAVEGAPFLDPSEKTTPVVPAGPRRGPPPLPPGKRRSGSAT